MNSSIDYKQTLLLPKTNFPMKANLAQQEPEKVSFWTKNNIHQKMVEKTKSSSRFTLPDGPPYANGYLHLGHVLNKILKDMVIKSQNLMGKSAAFVPGWDCHGLPIELKVTKKLGSKRAEMSDQEVRDLCRKEALHWIQIQKEQFQRLGVLADWDRPYLTLSPDFEANEVRLLSKILDQGLLYQGEKPVYWCPALQTALAAAEIEYRDHKSPSVYVKFDLQQNDELEKLGLSLQDQKSLGVVIWTTTPWTLPANWAICLNPILDYGVFKSDRGLLVIAEGLKESFEKDTGLELILLKTLKGKELEGLVCQHPFLDRDSRLIFGDHVTLEAGTGCVHTAPGHGLEDYSVGLKYNLPVDCPVDGAGRFTIEALGLYGLKIWDGNQVIIDHLQSSGHLLAVKQIQHSYPHNPRSKTPLIFRATKQWFIRYDDEKRSLRREALEMIENQIEFRPKWGQQRIRAMIENSPDWCLSRQRIWGVPIPVLYCEQCDEPLLSAEMMREVADLMQSSGQGIEAFFGAQPSEIAKNRNCSACGHTQFRKGKDILDVWFDSGSVHESVQRSRPELDYPADAYLEGSDQHRGWFQTSLISSIAAYRQSPFKTLITHGFVNDLEGQKMSKSAGNGIDPAEVIKNSGAEILRLWVAHEDYGQDVTVSNEIFQRISESYRRFRNTFRFMLGNLWDFDPSTDTIEFDQRPLLDQWMTLRLADLSSQVQLAYSNYEFHKVFHMINQFFVVDLSSLYLDVLKDRLYTSKATGVNRKASQTVIYSLSCELVKLMAPVTSFLSEEVYSWLPGSKKESIFLEQFSSAIKTDSASQRLMTEFDSLIELRSKISKELEQKRRDKLIGSSLDAKVSLELPKTLLEVALRHEHDLKELFIVSQLSLSEGEALKIEVQKAEGEKCIRCWHYSLDTGANEAYPGACPKCVEALI